MLIEKYCVKIVLICFIWFLTKSIALKKEKERFSNTDALISEKEYENGSSLLLIVGNVHETQVRIIYESMKSTSNQQTIHLRVYEMNWKDPIRHKIGFNKSLPSDLEKYRINQAPRIQLLPVPQVLVLKNLKPTKFYVVKFNELDYVSFTTLCDEKLNFECPKYRILALSCDRYHDDHDDGFWKYLIHHEQLEQSQSLSTISYGIFHLGDQIYADKGKQHVQQIKNGSLPSYLSFYRYIYRHHWSQWHMQHVLRTNSHWMLPDDHDVINNLYYYQYFQNPHLTNLVYAGREAFMEYQYQLQQDWTTSIPKSIPVPTNYSSSMENPLLKPYQMASQEKFYTLLKMGTIRWMFLDVRFQRSFLYEKDYPYLGKNQYEWMIEQLKEWKKDPKVKTIIIVTSIPLFLHTIGTARFVFFMEREMYPGYRGFETSMKRIFDAFEEYGYPKLKLFVGGDSHLYANGTICKRSNNSICFQQMITSGMTNGSSSMNDIKLFFFHFYVTRFSIGSTLQNWWTSFQQVYYGNNFGIIEVDPQSGDIQWNIQLRPYNSNFLDILQNISDFFIGWQLKHGIGILVVTVSTVLFIKKQ